MSGRNPQIDPRPGDELRGDPWRYRVIWVSGPIVMYEMTHATYPAREKASVSLSGWRDLAAGLTVERVA